MRSGWQISLLLSSFLAKSSLTLQAPASEALNDPLQPEASSAQASRTSAQTCVPVDRYDAAMQDIQTLETALEGANKAKTEGLEEIKKQFASVQKDFEEARQEVSNCQQASMKLLSEVKRIKAEAAESDRAKDETVGRCENELKQTLSTSTSKLQACKTEVDELQASSQQLREISVELKEAKTALSVCSEEKEAAKKDSRIAREKLGEVETILVSDRNKLQSLLTEEEKQRKQLSADREQSQKILKETTAELDKAQKKLHLVAKDNVIFSAGQLRKNLGKVAVLSKAVAVYVWGHVESRIPRISTTPFQEKFKVVRDYMSQLKLQVFILWKQAEPKVSLVVREASPYVGAAATRLRQLYEAHMAKSVALLTRRTEEACLQIQEALRRIAETASTWTNEKIVDPFLLANPSIRSLVPESNVDRLLALGYVLLIAHIVRRVACFAMCRVVLPALRVVLVLPILAVKRTCCSRRSRPTKPRRKGTQKKNAQRDAASREVKKEPQSAKMPAKKADKQ